LPRPVVALDEREESVLDRLGICRERRPDHHAHAPAARSRRRVHVEGIERVARDSRRRPSRAMGASEACEARLRVMRVNAAAMAD
jgi:hypothetical protein